ncbi:EamA family transporter [Oceanispirochaeta crateris]|uniref:EamA family transporter n=1 Tax=Oceanispirochaeta crateris TaxID=2518645 RepID=A0A5C1QPN3_9SPIO|nr:EamA family transporter [Oceanispirochaeta crateris]QEN09427.1 EamA family transporter [Oceanispirochaeta crateris]
MKRNEVFCGSMGVLAASFLWGTTGTAATFAPDVNPIAIGAAAMGIGGIMQFLSARGLISIYRNVLVQQWRLLLIGSVAIGVYPLTFYTSMKLAGVAVGTVISIGLAPLISALLESIIDRKKLSMKWKMGALIGILGVVLLCLTKSGQQSNEIQMMYYKKTFGVLTGVLAAFTYALFSYVAHKLMKRGVASRAAMGSLFGLGGAILLPVLLFTGKSFLNSWLNLAVGMYMATIPMFIGYLFFGYGLSKINASMATTLSLFEPAVATLFAVIIVGEQISLTAWYGIGLIIACLFILTVPVLDLNLLTRIRKAIIAE